MIQELENKVKEYVKKNVTISEKTYESWYNNGRIVKRASVECPCKSDRLQSVECHIDDNENVKGDWHIQELAWKLSNHIERKIRFRPDMEHVNILIELIGKEEALHLIHGWAKKNIAIAASLLKIVEKLNENVICVIDESGGKDGQ
jgi:hypothetical protein